MIYFDNAATTYKKPLSVKLATLAGLKVANPGRSGHSLSQKCAREISPCSFLKIFVPNLKTILFEFSIILI